MWFEQCYQFASTVSKEVQGKYRVPLAHDTLQLFGLRVS